MRSNFESAFWRTEVLDYKPFETWQEEGARETVILAAERVEKIIDTYQKPTIDAAVEEALNEYVSRKKISMPDSFN